MSNLRGRGNFSTGKKLPKKAGCRKQVLKMGNKIPRLDEHIEFGKFFLQSVYPSALSAFVPL